jgi:uncharacterized protein
MSYPERLADDSAVGDGGGWGGVTHACNVATPAEVDAVLAEACAATIERAAAPTSHPGTVARGRRQRPAALSGS